MEKPTLFAANREEWRLWLEQNHASAPEIWLIFYKKHTGQPTVFYEEAVEEALCFGWIDSIVRRIDDEKHMQKFSPRKDSSNWSEINKRRVWKMYKAGKMTAAGLSKVTFTLDESLEREPEPKPKKELAIPEHIRQVLEANTVAWENFNRLAPSHKRQYIGWITDAKKEETQLRRAGQAVELLMENKKLSEKLWDAQQLYPTQFSLRVMGEDKDSFARLVYGIVKTHVPELEEDRLTSRLSSAGKYLSVTITFVAQSREQLDAIYQDLSDEKRVLMVL